MNLKDVLVIAVRHGETTLNAQNKFRGSNNVPLDANGIKQAEVVAGKLAGHQYAHMVSSDRVRTITTAEIIAEATGIAFDITPNLRAWDIGFLSGKKKDEENKDILDYYIKHPNIPIPKGESLNAFKARVRPQVYEAIATAQAGGAPTILVVHSSIIHELGDMFHSNHEAVLVEPGGIAIIYMEKGKLQAKPVFRVRDKAVRKAGEIS
jgi:probable phosphoglycerate mutase